MKCTIRFVLLAIAYLGTALAADRAAAQYAVDVISYSAGTTAVPGYDDPYSALGSPERFTGTSPFESVVSPFSPPYLTSEIVSIGQGGQITLRLSNYVLPQAAAAEIGVFSNVGIVDVDYPNGQAGNPATTFSTPESAEVLVSENGASWASLGIVQFNVPTSGYTDSTDPLSSLPGNSPSDFRQPFAGNLSSFDGLPYYDADEADMLDLLAGSGGGTWLDISGSGLSQVGYIRFAVPVDGPSLNFELDAVSISLAAAGPATVPEPATLLLGSVALLWTALRSRRRRTTLGGQ